MQNLLLAIEVTCTVNVCNMTAGVGRGEGGAM